MFKVDAGFKKRLVFYLFGVLLGLFIVVPYVREKKEEVRLKKRMTIPRIDLPDQYGNIYTLDSLKGNVTIIEFWASWCAPCRGTNVQLKYFYKDFHGKEFKDYDDFEIVSISLDDDRSQWLKAMEKDSITWTSLIVEKGSKDSIIKRYGIKDIPMTILVDGEGVILAKTTHMDAIRTELESYLSE